MGCSFGVRAFVGNYRLTHSVASYKLPSTMDQRLYGNPMSNLRLYQHDSIARVLAHLECGKPTVLQMPTGAGKTVTAVELTRALAEQGPAWFICHRREILKQAIGSFTRAGLSFGVIAMGHEANPGARIQIASVDTLRHRHKSYAAPRTLIWDECHHLPAKSWSKIMRIYPLAHHVGLTATPERLDGLGLESLFSELVCGPTLGWLIGNGFLSPYRVFAPSEPDLSAARMSQGDYRAADIDKIMNTPVVIGDAVEHYKRIAPGKKALVFASSVAASQAVVAAFQAQGVPALHVDASTPVDERDDALAALAEGRIKVLSNVQVFTEGVDVPSVDAVIMLRPTKSLALYLQMVGRGLRTAEGKEEVLVLDHAGLVYEHGFPDADWEWSLAGGAREARIRKAKEHDERLRKCPLCSHVHAPSGACPSCGFEYGASGRDVAQFDGVLYELRNAVPDGYETQIAFARRVSYPQSTVCGWIRRGLPHNEDGYIPVSEGVLWVACNARPTVPDGYETPLAFARRCGLSKKQVIRLVQHGLPSNADGYIPVDEGLSWLVPNGPVDLKNGYESKAAFARRLGVNKATVCKWVTAGLPSDKSGRIPSILGEEWVQAHTRPKAPYGCETMTVFAKRFNVTVGAIRSWIQRGLPAEDGFIRIDDGIRWAEARKETIAQRKGQLTHVEGYESQKAFAERVGVSKNTVNRLVKKGLPVDAVGRVHVAPALLWLHQNFDRDASLKKSRARASS